MDIYKSLGVNADAEVNGRWVKVGDFDVLVARAYNKKYNKVWKSLIEPELKDAADAKGGVSEARTEELLNRALAETILLGWKGIEVEGVEFPYSVENAYKLLSEPNLRPFREGVLGHALSDLNYKLKYEEQAVEQLKKN